MPVDFVIGLSLVVVAATLAGMFFAYRYVMRHIAEDSLKAASKK